MTKRRMQLLALAADQTILFAFRWSGLTGPPLFAHIHIGQVGVNGGVSAFLCGGSTKPVCPQSTSATITGSIGPDDVIGPSGQGVDPGEWGELVSAIRAGFAYANIHTSRLQGRDARPDPDRLTYQLVRRGSPVCSGGAGLPSRLAA